MKTGLVLGKFMPLHKGHLALFDFALANCDELIILICATIGEPIPGETRLKWITDTYKNNIRIKPQLLLYDDAVLPNTSISSEQVSQIWAEYLKERIKPISIIFASELYGRYMADYMKCDYKIFDINRVQIPVSSTKIRSNSFNNWDFIPDNVKPFYLKKICLYGTESTGKTTLTEKLAIHFKTTFVKEMARDILENTINCTPQHLIDIAILHANTIKSKKQQANKMLFIDTDLNITRSYSKFLFGSDLMVPKWVEEQNYFDLYLYLDNDCDFVQDGTRLPFEQRNLLNESHKAELQKRNIDYVLITGNWEERFNKSVEAVNKVLSIT
jgi:HTH-type transcriptional repressor of NAD biosynthesis genes